MTIKELKELPDGTLIYNGRHEGVIKTDCGDKVIEILIPIYAMSNGSNDFDERPEWWSVIEETE